MKQNGNEFTLEITGLTHEGQGVGKLDGYAVFVDGALPGETIRAQWLEKKQSYGRAKLLTCIQPSKDRVDPFCQDYVACGGCAVQHLSYPAGLRWKTQMVKETLRRIGGLDGIDVFETIGMELPKQYRNKAQYPVSTFKGKAIAGFYQKGSHRVVNIKDCGIQTEYSQMIKSTVVEFLNQYKISVYDEKSHTGLVRHIMTREAVKTGESMLVLVLNGTSMPHQEEFIDILVKRFAKLQTILINQNTKRTNVILGDQNQVIFGNGFITEHIGPFQFQISPHSFFQVNPLQTEVLYGKALEYAGLTGQETVFDLYCGIGTISLFLSQQAKRVIGVEVVAPAVEDAKRNALQNGVNNVEFLVGEAEQVVPKLYEEGTRADVVVVDPPRKGCDETLLAMIVQMKPEKVVYVSCNPATLARDLKYLTTHGYEVKQVQPVDMFPWTGHVETVVLLSNVKNG